MGARKGKRKGGKAQGGFDTFEAAVTLRALALMQKSGVPLIDGTEVTIAGGFPGPVSEALKRALEGMRAGRGFAESLGPSVPRLVAQVCAAGEATGKLDAAMTALADELMRRLRHRDGKDMGGQARQMAHTLSLTVSFGLPLIKCLEIAAEECLHPGLRKGLLGARDDITAGGNFADALAKRPDEFGPFFTAYMRVGEDTGTLDTVLARMASLIDEMLELQRYRGKSRLA